MLLVREVFIAKPGSAGELAKMMKNSMKDLPTAMNVKVLLDFVTNYNKIVIEYEIASLADFEKMMGEERSKQQSKAGENTGPKYTDLYLTGKREVFRFVE